MVTKVKVRKLNKGVFLNRVMVLSLSLVILLLATGSVVANDVSDNYREVVVKSGDTLWIIIQENYEQGTDMEEALYNIKKFNNKNTSAIYPGEKLKIPLKN